MPALSSMTMVMTLGVVEASNGRADPANGCDVRLGNPLVNFHSRVASMESSCPRGPQTLPKLKEPHKPLAWTY